MQSIHHSLDNWVMPLTGLEVNNLKTKIQKERIQYLKVAQILVIFSLVAPFIIAWYRKPNDVSVSFSIYRYIIIAFILILLTMSCLWITYNIYTRKMAKDLQIGTKTLGMHKITKKAFVQIQSAYFLYINSAKIITIQVAEQDFKKYNEGDEIAIEYYTYSKDYIGYY